jgi:hypothetical protein
MDNKKTRCDLNYYEIKIMANTFYEFIIKLDKNNGVRRHVA